MRFCSEVVGVVSQTQQVNLGGGVCHPNACRARTLHGLANRGCALMLEADPEAQNLKLETLKQDQQKEQQGYTNSDAEALSGLREKAAAIAKRMQASFCDCFAISAVFSCDSSLQRQGCWVPACVFRLHPHTLAACMQGRFNREIQAGKMPWFRVSGSGFENISPQK